VRFVFEKHVPVRRQLLFRFHECPAHLAVLHAGWSKVRLLQHEERLRVGGETWLEQTVAGLLPVILGFRHTLLEPPFRFAEELIHGPFARFSHVHEFVEQGPSTLVRDIVEFEWPWWFGGRLASHLCIERGIRAMFSKRGDAMVRLAENGQIKSLAANFH
jgi:ligand-binding SRPBCC domain-containing protein